MQGYLNKGKDVLKILVNNGYEAYFFGDTVRNSLIGIDCDEIRIMTNASSSELFELFKNKGPKTINSLLTKINIDGYIFLISTYSDSYLGDGFTKDVKRVSSGLLDNLSKSVFTIDSLAMSLSGKITDAYGGYKDIRKKVVKTVGQAKQRFYEDPVNILKALALVSELNYAISKQVEVGIKKRVKLLAQSDIREISSQMEIIVNGRFGRKALAYFLQFGINKVLPFYDKALKKFIGNGKEMRYDDFLACCFVANGEIDETYLELCNNKDKVMAVASLSITNPKSDFENISLFVHGKDICLSAFKVNRVLCRTKRNLEKKIIKKWDELPIKKKCDIKFKGEDIMRISDLRDANKIGDLFEDLVYQVVTCAIPNDYNKLQAYACIKLKEMGINYDVNRKEIIHFNKETGEPVNELDDYAKFISGVNNNKDRIVDTNYWHEGLSDKKDSSFFDLPNPKTRTVPLYVDDNDDSIDGNGEDEINYNNYKDPTIPNYESLKKDNANLYNTHKEDIKEDKEFPFESELEDDNEVTYVYEHKINEETDLRIKKLEERLNEQDRLLQGRGNNQKIISITNKIVDDVLADINLNKDLADNINKADFASKVADFVQEYLERNLPR